MRMTVLPKSHLGRWSMGLAASFIMLLFVSTAVFIGLGALAPNRAGLIALIVEIAALSISGIGAFAAGLISITKSIERSILVFLAVVISLIGVLLLGAIAWGSPKELSEEEIISFVLTHDTMEGRYDVFDPEMSLNSFDSNNYEDNIRYRFQQEGFDFDTLVTALFANNTKPVRMNIPSSPEKGYLIDYDGKFQSYFEKDGGGWAQLHQENPEARDLVHLSVPAYDPKTGLLMIYLGWYSEGRIIVYKYVFGKLLPIISLLIWYS